MKNKILDNTKMYRLPYSKNDNPNGWIEVTTYCNMKCPGCYKGIDRADSVSIHEPLEKIKQEILDLKRIRNCGLITISGGEAIMHPQIEEIVSFIKKLKLQSFIHTNGILVNKMNVLRLKKAGLTGFIIRVDIGNRPDFSTEADLNNERDKFAKLIYEIRGLQLGFTCVIDKDNLEQIPDIVKWAQSNNDYVDYLVLILKREFKFKSNEQLNTDNEVDVEDLAKTLTDNLKGLTFSSYLGSQSEDVGYKWVQSSWISFDKIVLGYADPKLVEFSTVYNHLKNGDYSYITGVMRNCVSLISLVFGALFFSSMRNVLLNYLKYFIKNPKSYNKKANVQALNIVNPPKWDDNQLDYCDACPDAVFHNGKLVPSCTREIIARENK